jgi:hypothetical protein
MLDIVFSCIQILWRIWFVQERMLYLIHTLSYDQNKISSRFWLSQCWLTILEELVSQIMFDIMFSCIQILSRIWFVQERMLYLIHTLSYRGKILAIGFWTIKKPNQNQIIFRPKIGLYLAILSLPQDYICINITFQIRLDDILRYIWNILNI